MIGLVLTVIILFMFFLLLGSDHHPEEESRFPEFYFEDLYEADPGKEKAKDRTDTHRTDTQW